MINIELLIDSKYTLCDVDTGNRYNISEDERDHYFNLLIKSLIDSKNEIYNKIPSIIFARFNKTKSARTLLNN